MIGSTGAAEPGLTPTFTATVPDVVGLKGWRKLAGVEALFKAAAAVEAGNIVEVTGLCSRFTVALCAGSSVGAKVPVHAIEPGRRTALKRKLRFLRRFRVSARTTDGAASGAPKEFASADRAAIFGAIARTDLTAPLRLVDATSRRYAATTQTRDVALLVIGGNRKARRIEVDFAVWRPHLRHDATVVLKAPDMPGPKAVIEAFVGSGILRPSGRARGLAFFHHISWEPSSGRRSSSRSIARPAQASSITRPEYCVPWKGIGREVYYGHDGAYLYQPILKCACTTIKTLLLEFEGLPIDDDLWRRHQKSFNNFPGTGHLPDEKQRDIFEGRTTTFKFIIVRNPYARLASVYHDKVLPREAFFINKLRLAAGGLGIQLSRSIGFDEFVDLVSQQSFADMDPHWRPQYYAGRFANIHYDFVGRMENMPDDLMFALKRIGAPQSIIERADTRHNETGSNLVIWKTVPRAVRERFVSKFALDFDTLGYSRGLEETA